MKETCEPGASSFVASRDCVLAGHKCGREHDHRPPCLVRLVEEPQCSVKLLQSQPGGSTEGRVRDEEAGRRVRGGHLRPEA